MSRTRSSCRIQRAGRFSPSRTILMGPSLSSRGRPSCSTATMAFRAPRSGSDLCQGIHHGVAVPRLGQDHEPERRTPQVPPRGRTHHRHDCIQCRPPENDLGAVVDLSPQFLLRKVLEGVNGQFDGRASLADDLERGLARRGDGRTSRSGRVSWHARMSWELRVGQALGPVRDRSGSVPVRGSGRRDEPRDAPGREATGTGRGRQNEGAGR